MEPIQQLIANQGVAGDGIMLMAFRVLGQDRLAHHRQAGVHSMWDGEHEGPARVAVGVGRGEAHLQIGPPGERQSAASREHEPVDVPDSGAASKIWCDNRWLWQ